MLKKLVYGLLCLLLLTSTAATNAYFFEEIYLSSSETKVVSNLIVGRYDYESYAYIYLNGNASLYRHVIEARSRLVHGQGDTCTYKMELFAFDKDNHNTLVEDSVFHTGNTDWSPLTMVDIQLDAEYAILYFNFENCNLNQTSAMDIEITMDREALPVDVQFWADAYTIPRGQCTYLNWEVENSLNVSLDGETVNPYDYRYVCLDVTTTFTLYVTAQDGTIYSKSVIIYVEDRPQADIDFWGDEYSILAGSCTDLHWEIRNTEKLEAFLDNIPKYGSMGTQHVCPAKTTTYELCAVGLDGNYTCEDVIIEVLNAQFWADKNVVHKGECTNLYWEVQGSAGIQTWFEGTKFKNFDSTKVCPETDQTYELCFSGSEGGTQCLQVTVEVDDGTPYLVVVTHSANLNNRVSTPDAWEQIESWINGLYDSVSIIDLDEEGINPTDFNAIDQAIEDVIQQFDSNPKYILIVGGPDVVAFGELDNPMWEQACRTDEAGNRRCDWDILYSDDLYGDVVHDSNTIPEIPVARIPDGGDFEIFRIHFQQTGFPKGTDYETNYLDNFAIGHPNRLYVGPIGSMMNASATEYVPPKKPSDYMNLWGRWIYFILHGARNDTTKWWGEEVVNGETTYPEGWDITVSKHWEVVVSGACYGGFLGEPSNPKNTSNSIALSFLRHGARAFMGYTVTAYSPRGTETIDSCDGQTCQAIPIENVPWSTNEGNAFLGSQVYRAMVDGLHPLDAYWQAKIALANSLGPTNIFDAELKVFHGFQFYGLPPFNEISF